MSANLQDGVFFMRSKLHGKVISVLRIRSVVVCCTTDPSTNQISGQLFQITPAAGYLDHYHITNVGTRHVLDLDHGQPTGQVLAWPKNGRQNQAWSFQSIGGQFGTSYAVVNKKTGTVLDLMCSDQREGAPIIGHSNYKTSNQQWEFVGVPESIIGSRVMVPGPERVVEVEVKVPGPERLVEKIVEVEKLVDDPETLKKLDEMKRNFYLAMQGWRECRNG